MSPMSFMNQDEHSNQEIGDDENKNTGESTWSSDIKEDDSDTQQDVLYVSQMSQGIPLLTSSVPLPENGAMPTLSLHALCFQMPKIHLRQWHHQSSNFKCQPSSTNHWNLAAYHMPGDWCYPTSLLETRMLHNPRCVVIRMFPTTKRLLLRQQQRLWRKSYSQRFLGQYSPMTSTGWLEKLEN